MYSIIIQGKIIWVWDNQVLDSKVLLKFPYRYIFICCSPTQLFGLQYFKPWKNTELFHLFLSLTINTSREQFISSQYIYGVWQIVMLHTWEWVCGFPRMVLVTKHLCFQERNFSVKQCYHQWHGAHKTNTYHS